MKNYLNGAAVVFVLLILIIGFVYLPASFRATGYCIDKGYHFGEIDLKLNVTCVKYAEKTLME